MKILFFLLLLSNVVYFLIQYSNLKFKEDMLAASTLKPQILLLKEADKLKK